jgi:hypothetical protein
VISKIDEFTSWQAVNILHDFQAPPSPELWVEPSLTEIRQLDTAGGELWFKLTPKDDPGCVQHYKVGWNFDRDIGIVSEGESFNVQLFVEPQGDTGSGLSTCYTQAKARAYWGGQFTIQFRPSSSNKHTQEYPEYHEGSAQYLFHKTTDVYGVGYEQGSAVDGFRVVDSPYASNIGYMNASHGSISFSISKGGVFTYVITYLYDALGTGSLSSSGMGHR